MSPSAFLPLAGPLAFRRASLQRLNHTRTLPPTVAPSRAPMTPFMVDTSRGHPATAAPPMGARRSLTLTDPADLALMVSHLKREHFDKGDYLYPIKTVCAGEDIDVRFAIPFEPRLSSHYAALYNSRNDRAKLYAVPPRTTDMRKYNRINCEKMGALLAPNSAYGDTEAVSLFYSMMYYLNDQTAICKLPEDEIELRLVDELNDNVLQYLGIFLSVFEPRDAADLERIWDFLDFYQPYFRKAGRRIVLDDKYLGQTPPQVALVTTIANYVAERFGATKNITQVVYEVIRYVKGIKQEVKIRCDKGFTLSLAEYDDFRDQVTSSPMAHSVTDLTHDAFSYEAYKNPVFNSLENLTSQVITYINDVCTCDRERLDKDPFNSVFILKDRDGLNFADACDLVVAEIEKKMAKFLETKKQLLSEAADEERRTAMAQMIKTREDSIIGYMMHEVCCVTDGYARDHKPKMKEYLEKAMFGEVSREAM
uniref:KabA n=1 Tax=Rhodophysema elegans TaxID=39578 RepID=A0A4D6I7U2_9FLOR|nr:KabA [Rhodophysema elegans]